MARPASERPRGSGGSRKSSGSRDPLGKLIERHHVTLAGVLVISGFIAAIGGGLAVYALTRNPVSQAFLIVGGAIVLLAVVLLVINVFNVGRKLELRKRGLRYVASGTTTEMFWEDIADVEIDRLDSTNVGVGTSYRRSSDGVSPSGLLTKSEFEVTIHAADGRRIVLPRGFLRIVGDPQKLISHLRLRAGLP